MPGSHLSRFYVLVGIFNDAVTSGRKPPSTELRVKLIQEEAQEFADAVKEKDIVEAIDGLCDLLYVTYGAAYVFDIPMYRSAVEDHIPESAPSWGRIADSMEGFNGAVSDAVTALRSGNRNQMELAFNALVTGCWEAGAEGLGVDLKPFFLEVHRTNMNKLRGPKREDGKQLKPSDWKPPRIEAMYNRLLAGNPATCMEKFSCDPTLSVAHPGGGQFCPSCGGLYVETTA
jgi:Phosphoribosyl-ATP pyrophosphohydrolase